MVLTLEGLDTWHRHFLIVYPQTLLANAPCFSLLAPTWTSSGYG
jgi:hypothetical protein